ncbi:MAG: adenylate/guanylate cyclase domain-containing protein [Acidobacteriota bacterium]
MSRNTKKVLMSVVILTGTVIGVTLFSKYFPYLENLELKNYDFMLAVLRGPLPPPDNLVVVAIDDDSIKKFLSQGFPFPWPRSFHADLIRVLAREGARAIVFDVVFEGQSPDPQEDEELAQAIREVEVPVIIANYIEVIDDPRFSMVQKGEVLETLVEAGGLVGFATLNPDRDGVIRSGRLFVGGEPTLVTRTLEALGTEPVYETLPISSYEGEDPEILVNYVGGSRTIPTVSYEQVLSEERALPAGFFRNKIVFVGYSLAVSDLSQGGGRDHYPSPFDQLSGTATMPGVETHANLLDTILRGRYIRRLGFWPSWIMILAPALLISVLVVRVESFVWKIFGSLGFSVFFLFLGIWFFVWAQTWVFMIQPLVIMVSAFGLNLLYQYRLTERERAQIRRALSGYVSKQVMGEIMKNPDQLELGGVQVEATVLFSDIAGFSKLSERITPRELATLLNDYFTKMGDIIMELEGMINKYIGDAIMAIWNAPLPSPRHAHLACKAALRMKKAVDAMAPLKMRIGINTGPMVAGNLGHRERMEYTVIGDSVNLASRLEGANKAFGTAVMISESTQALVQNDFLMRRLDRIRVVGKQQPIAVYEVLADRSEPVSPELEDLVVSHNGILEAYDTRDWERALELIDIHLSRFPDDTVAQTYQKRCRHFLEAPPPAEWDGVFALEVK